MTISIPVSRMGRSKQRGSNRVPVVRLYTSFQ